MTNGKIHKFFFEKHNRLLLLLRIMVVFSILTFLTIFVATMKSNDATNRTSLATYNETPVVTCTQYVAQDGSDSNPGTESSPWLTIQKAADTAVGGNTVCVKTGTYNEHVSITRSGSSGNYITFAAYPGQAPVIDGTGKVGNWDGIIHFNSANWIKFIGFTVTNSTWNGIQITNYAGTPSSNILIQNNTVSNIGYAGLYAGDSSYITYDGNTITQTQTNGNGGPNGQQTNENVDMIGVSNFVIKNNTIYSTAHFESIVVKIGSSYGSIHNNNIIPTESCGIYIDAWNAPEQNIDIYDNYIHDGSGTTTRGIAVAAEEVGGSIKYVNIYNNIISNLPATGITLPWYSRGSVDTVKIINNTVYKTDTVAGWSGGISIQTVTNGGSNTNITVSNNIVSQNNVSQIYNGIGANATITNNLFDGVGGTTGSSIVTGDPIFVDPSGGNFQLQSSSPAIDMGTSTDAPSADYDGNPRPVGAGYDIGAYEYIAPTPTPTLTPTPTPTDTPTPTPTLTPTPTPTDTPTPTPTLTPTPTPTFPSGLSAYWNFDENTGNETYDSSSNSNIGTIYGAKWTTGKIGSALYFNGKNNYVNAGNNPNLQITGALTLEGWVKLNSLSVNSGLFGRGRAFGSNGNYGYFLSYYAPARSIYFDTYSTTKRSALRKTNAITNNKWHHIAATWDGTTSTNGMKLYIDGKLIAQRTSNITSIGIPPFYNFRIGTDSLGYYPAKAVIDEVRVYNRALSASEILSDYKQR